MKADDIAPNVRTLTALMDLAAAAGAPHLTFELLEGMESAHGLKPNVYSFNVALRTALALGDSDRADALQAAMQDANILPDVVTFTTLARYGHISDDHRRSFISFLVAKGLKPDRGSYAIALRELLAAGMVQESWLLYTSMPPHLRRRILAPGLKSKFEAALSSLDAARMDDGVARDDACAVVRGECKLEDVAPEA